MDGSKQQSDFILYVNILYVPCMYLRSIFSTLLSTTCHESCLQQMEFYLLKQKCRGGAFDGNSEVSLVRGGGP